MAGLVFGLAVAAGAPDFVVGKDGEAAEIEQAINVAIPPRYALHLTATEWVLDLGNLTLDDACYLVPKRVTFGWRAFKDYVKAWHAGRLGLTRTTHYPAVILDNAGNIAVVGDEYQKGTLICFFEKVLQKFTNVPDWQLEVLFDADYTGYGRFHFVDFLANRPIIPFGTSGDSELFFWHDERGTTGGWLNNTLVEAFWFDGSEVAGNYRIDLTFTLTHW